MIKILVFGGATEGRKLCEVCAEYAIPIRYCVATTYGARLVESLSNVHVRVGRLGAEEMASLMQKERPALVIDATHPYAKKASLNIAAACQSVNITLVCVEREGAKEQNCIYFNGMDDLLAWLEQETGSIFVATGLSYAKAFAKLFDYQSRVWLRVLPNTESLGICLDLGYRPEQLVCMQGPFSEELNRAMFKTANARILVTKDSGAAGGFTEKIRAAQSLGMITAVLKKPNQSEGVSLEEARLKIMELRT